jgi:PPK2 family polyphosphate:nucleotide phosphotransferase
MKMRELWRVKPGSKVDIRKYDPSATPGLDGGEPSATAVTQDDADELAGYQDRLWAEATRSLLIVLQGMDAAGKDGTIKHVFHGVNPQGTRVAIFKEPTPEELAHDFLWRVHRVTPRAGEIGIFNRSHYEDVLVVRVRNLVPEKVWRPRYQHINHFEDLLVTSSTTVIKFFLHISKEEQKKRLEQRLEKPDKRWKLLMSDLETRKHWDEYQIAYQDVLEKTSTDVAPWYVIPANHKWYRNWAISRVLIETLKEMNPQYPQPQIPKNTKIV